MIFKMRLQLSAFLTACAAGIILSVVEGGEYCPVCNMAAYCNDGSHCCNNNDGKCCPANHICIPTTSVCIEYIYVAILCAPVLMAIISASTYCVYSLCRNKTKNPEVIVILPDQTEYKGL